MQQVDTLIASASAEHQPQNPNRWQKGPFRTPIHDRDEERPASCETSIPSSRQMSRAASSEARPATSSAVLIGEAGSSLVLSRLLAWGISAQTAMAGATYDIIADVPGFDMVRIQVKTRTRIDRGQCTFTMNRGFGRSKKGFFPYTANDFDLAAFVALPLERMFFFPGPVARIRVRTSWLRLPGTDRETLDLALRAIRGHRQSEMLSWLASMTDGDGQGDIPASPVAAPASQLAFSF